MGASLALPAALSLGKQERGWLWATLVCIHKHWVTWHRFFLTLHSFIPSLTLPNFHLYIYSLPHSVCLFLSSLIPHFFTDSFSSLAAFITRVTEWIMDCSTLCRSLTSQPKQKGLRTETMSYSQLSHQHLAPWLAHSTCSVMNCVSIRSLHTHLLLQVFVRPLPVPKSGHSTSYRRGVEKRKVGR